MLTTNSFAQNLTEFVKDSDGNEYRTVKIGEQLWLAENLRTTSFQNGAKVTTGFIPNDDAHNLLTYGRLYNWHDISNPNKLCPKGWRVATDDDWKILERTIGVAEKELDKEGWRGEHDVAITLKARQPNSWFKRFDQTQVNKHHFSATPAGVKLGKWYITQSIYTEFWTGTSATNKSAFARTLAYSWWNPHKGQIRRTSLSKSYMLSVRCVKI